MLVLGLNPFELTSSAAFVKDGKLVFAACEERFSRIKRDKCFPYQAIRAGLKFLGITFSDVDAVSIGWNPGVEAFKINGLLPARPRELYYFKLQEAMASFVDLKQEDCDWSMLRTSGSSVPDIYFVRHHLSHASNAVFQSPFDSGDFLTLDFMGERQTGCFGEFKSSEISAITYSKQPSSAGAFYAAITQLLGYKPDSDEWKVMALSALGADHAAVQKYIGVFKDATLPGDIAPFLKNQFFNTDSPREKYLTTPALWEALDFDGFNSKKTQGDLRQWQIDVATAMQKFISEFTLNALSNISSAGRNRSNSICLSGGFFMNCVFNGVLERSGLYENVFVSQSPADLGNSIGSALFLHHQILGNERVISGPPKLFTSTYCSDDVKSVLDNCQLRYEEFESEDDQVGYVAAALKNDQVIALIDGRAEFGERALGARSILAMPQKKEMKDIINSKIKYREDYRPFAPVCLESFASKYFTVPDGYKCHAMEKTVEVRAAWVSQLQAITHDDQSARLQTIPDDSSQFLARLLNYFVVEGDLPVLINTSFNLNGEPNVETLQDGIRTFFSSGLDLLVVNEFVLVK